MSISRLDERAPLPLAYANVFVTVDRAAARLLDDQSAAARASALHQRTAVVRFRLALQQRRERQRQKAERVARMARMDE
ncbi:hypothetical protein Rwratislav_15388 [Rhodococcus wratislaviensis IFP 2016]|nr:hypothetical protein Rwratislav_15388 [Rhodococcus wratislaviensis IFP 2016]